MARTGDDARRARAARRATLGGIWLAGLLTGFVALLAATAKYGCAEGDSGLACRTSGSLLGLLVLLVVLAVVIAETLLTAGRDVRAVLLLGSAGLGALVLCFVAARALLATA